MPDQIFEHPRLVSIYDAFDGYRTDLDHYVAIAKELNPKSVLDIGSGTGCLACLLSEQGFEVTGVEPARASLEYAKSRPHANQVHWIFGEATDLPNLKVDLAVMTGNVAQIFLTDTSWAKTLLSIRRSLQPRGHLVFEVRDPSKKAWLEWTKERTYSAIDLPKIGRVEGWCNVTDVSDELVSFRWTYVFESDGQVMTSDSTLRFREKAAIEESLVNSGYRVREIRESPDRPGKEFVFIADLA